MPPGMILRRLWREWRLAGILLLAVCLVTGFLALGPLYVRAISEAGVRFVVNNAAPDRLNITLTSPQPIGPEAWDLLNAELGGVVSDITRITRSAGNVLGFRYQYGQPVMVFTPTTPNRYRVVAYSNFEDLFTLSAGRWPVRLAPPDDRALAALSDEEREALQVGVYSRGDVEAVVTTAVAEEAGIEVGTRIAVGAEYSRTAIVHIVGLVEPLLPEDDPFWSGQRAVLTGDFVPVGLLERFDFGLIIPEGAYDDWIAPVTDADTYLWQLRTDPDVIHADTVDLLEASLERVQGALRARYPGMAVISELPDLIATFRQGIAATEGPIILLSGAVLVLMLYHLVTTVALVLEQQSVEWASMASRGGSTRQLIGMQLVSMSVLGLIGFALGPFIGQAILLGLARLGPLGRVLGGVTPALGTLPGNAFVLSLIAAVTAVVVLTLPAWPAARRSLLRLKEVISRPPTRPAWARYFLDLALLVAGLAFLLRLYFLIGGDVGRSLEALIQDSASLIRLIAEEAGESGLTDPFNLVGPALVLTGAALLWLRIFPLLVRLVGKLFGGSNGLTAPLAIWNVERDPGHYAQLVLLLIGTLALGTASLALSATRDAGAWQVARQETGAVARVALDPRQARAGDDWLALPEVTTAASLVVAPTARGAGSPPVTLFGVDPLGLGRAFPELEAALAPLADTAPSPLPGLPVPDEATALTVQVYAEPSPEEPTQTSLTAAVEDSLGVPVALPMTTPDEFDAGRFVPYTAALPDRGRPPWRLIGLRLVSHRGDLQDFSHTVYLDDLAAVTAGGEATSLTDFEGEAAAAWASGPGQSPVDLTLTPSAARAVSGALSLQVDYRIRRVAGLTLEPSLEVNRLALQPVPVVLSATAAQWIGARTSRREPLRVGDEGTVNLALPQGTVQMPYRVVGLVEAFPTMIGRDLFVLARAETLRPILNRVATVHDYYDWNQVWLELETREPGEAFRDAVVRMPGFVDAAYAWDRFGEFQREPLPNAVTGMLFAGFWVSLGLSALDFAFYLAVTARRRAISYAVLRAIGWEARYLWSLLAVEQAALIIPALLVGVALGAGLAYLLLPFLALVGGEVLRVPFADVAGLLAVLVVTFAILLGATAVALRRMSVHQTLRLGEE